jgi:hypothetical protein
MADRTRTVGTDQTHASLNAALAAELASQSNLTTSGGVCTIECYFISGGDTAAVTAKAFTGADANNYLRIVAIDRHAGVPNTATAYYIAAHAAEPNALFDVPYTRIEGIQVFAPVDHGKAVTVSGANCLMDGCIIKSVDDVGLGITGAGVTVRNTLLYECGRAGFQVYPSSGTVTLSCCTAVDCTRNGFERLSGTCVAANCLSYSNGNNSTYFDFAGTMTMTDCASMDNSAAGASPHTGISDPFFDYANDDFHLAAASAMIDAGTDLYSSGVTTDIDSETLTVRDDIGADEIVSEAPPATGSPWYALIQQ